MSVKVLADKVLAFDRGEIDNKGILIQVRTKIGFNELPDWVAKTDFFKDAEKDGSLKAFTDSSQSENVQKEQEKLAALKAEIAELEQKKAMLKENSKDNEDLSEGNPNADPKAPEAPKTEKTTTKDKK